MDPERRAQVALCNEGLWKAWTKCIAFQEYFGEMTISVVDFVSIIQYDNSVWKCLTNWSKVMYEL